MNNQTGKVMPSEDIQKKYEANPSFLLEKIRKENNKKESKNSIEQKTEEKEKENYTNLIYNKKISLSESNNLQQKKQNLFNSNLNSNININIINPLIINNNYKINNYNPINLNNFSQSQIDRGQLQPLNGFNYVNNNFPLFSNNYQNNFLYPGNIYGNKKIILKYEVEKIFNALKNYWGSIFLQNNLDSMDDYEISILLNNIIDKIDQIMCLEYGNYFFRKLIKRLKLSQKLIIYQKIKENFLLIAKDKSGTHSIQFLIGEIQTPVEQNIMDNLINQNLLILFNDKNASHIIMKIIIERPENQRNFINFFIINNIEKIAINPYGSYCVNKFIVNNTDLNLRDVFLKNIKSHIEILLLHKSSCSLLFLLLKNYNIDSCKFIFQEVKNRIDVLIQNPTSLSFSNKILQFLYVNNSSILTSFIWDIYKNDDLLKSLLKTVNGEIFINKCIYFSNTYQKKYIKEKFDVLKK